jgi:hypothetical protein
MGHREHERPFWNDFKRLYDREGSPIRALRWVLQPESIAPHPNTCCSEECAGILKQHWPALYKHFKTSISDLVRKNEITEDEAFAEVYLQWCPNIPLPHLPKHRRPTNGVYCGPHIDSKNLAYGVCAILIYAHKSKPYQ